MSDAELRELERAAANGDASDKRRLDEALCRELPGVVFARGVRALMESVRPSEAHELGRVSLPEVADEVIWAEEQRAIQARSPRPGVSWTSAGRRDRDPARYLRGLNVYTGAQAPDLLYPGRAVYLCEATGYTTIQRCQSHRTHSYVGTIETACAPSSAVVRLPQRPKSQVVLVVATEDCIVVGCGVASAGGMLTPGAAWHDELWPWRIDTYDGADTGRTPEAWLSPKAKSWKSLRAWCGCDLVPQDSPPVLHPVRSSSLPIPAIDRIHARRSEALAWAWATREKGFFE